MACGCCPLQVVRCFQAPTSNRRFQSVQVTANPSNHPISNLNSTIDGNAGADLSGFTPPIPANQNPNPATTIDYVLSPPLDNVTGFQWWNGGGTILNDGDGVGTMHLQLLDAANVILSEFDWSVAAPTNNNVPPRTINFAAVDGLARVRISQITKQVIAQSGTGCPLWRQFQVQVSVGVQRAVGMRCVGTEDPITWFDVNGDQIPEAQFVPCLVECVPAPPNLEIVGVAFNTFNTGAGGDTATTEETLYNLSQPPTALGAGTVLVPSSNGYGASAAAGVNSCGGRQISLTFAQPDCGGLQFTYGSGNPARPNAGGVYLMLNSPSTGPITWPPNTVYMSMGEERISNLLANGTRARLTYLSGPTQLNSANMNFSTTCTVVTPGNLVLHQASTNAQSFTYRLDFVQG